MAIVARAGTAVVKTRFCVRHSPSLTSQTRPVEQLYHCCVPGLRSAALAAFCGMASVSQAASKPPHGSPPKRRGIPVRRRFGFESRIRASASTHQATGRKSLWPGFRSDSKAKAASASRRTEHSQGSKAACRKHTASKQGSQLARPASASHAAGAAPAPRGRLHSTHELK